MLRRRINRVAPCQLPTPPTIDRSHKTYAIQTIAPRPRIGPSGRVDLKHGRNPKAVGSPDASPAECIETLHDDVRLYTPRMTLHL